MNRFEDELRDSLKRRKPPPGLAERVLADTRQRATRARPRAAPAWRWGLAAAAVLTVSLTPLVYMQHLRALEGERAKEQVLSAFHVAGSSLRRVQARVAEVESRRSPRQ